MDFGAIGENFSPALRKRVQRALRMAGVGMTAEEYLGLALVVSFLAFLILLPLSPLLSVIALALTFSLFLYTPSYLAFLRGKRAEKELPFFLKSFHTLISSGLPPLDAVLLSARGNPVLEGVSKNVVRMVGKGISVGRALEVEAESFASERVKRTLLMVSETVLSGHGYQALNRYADSLLSAKRIEVKETSSKIALYTLVYIAITALVPSILIIYNSLLPNVIGGTPDMPTLLFTLFFMVPLSTTFLLAYIGGRI